MWISRAIWLNRSRWNRHHREEKGTKVARSKKTQAAIDGALSLDVAQDQVGLGVDLVEIDRMRAILNRTASFSGRYFTEAEREYCNSKTDPTPHYAARFAAKEAVVKSLGCGFSQGVRPVDIEIESGKGGRPEVVLHGAALDAAARIGAKEIPISLSQTRKDAIACAIAITHNSQIASEKRKDPMEELTRQFKDARSMLDEL